jgi:hypothetical protein
MINSRTTTRTRTNPRPEGRQAQRVEERFDTDADPDDAAVNHPAHYNLHPAGIEAIEVIEHFNVGTAAKYLWRAGLKVSPNGDEHDARLLDLKKAAWYIDREIDRLNAENKQ